jgi:hypothetical protein
LPINSSLETPLVAKSTPHNRAAPATPEAEVKVESRNREGSTAFFTVKTPRTPPGTALKPKQEDFTDQPFRGVIHMITGGSSADFDTKRQKKEHYRRVNHVSLTGPAIQTKWSHIPITFNARDVDLRSAPHADAMVINCRVGGWDLHKVLIDNGSQVDIIFLHAFDCMGINHNLLKPTDNPL